MKKQALIFKIIVIVLVLFLVYVLFRYATTMRDTGKDMVNASGGFYSAIPEIANTRMTLRRFEDSEIKYHLDIEGTNENVGIYGFVQIVSINRPLKDYLKLSHEFLSSNVFNLCEKPAFFSKYEGVQWTYRTGKSYVRQEFYPVSDNEIIIFSLSMSNNIKNSAASNAEFDNLFNKILKGFE